MSAYILVNSKVNRTVQPTAQHVDISEKANIVRYISKKEGTLVTEGFRVIYFEPAPRAEAVVLNISGNSIVAESLVFAIPSYEPADTPLPLRLASSTTSDYCK